MGGYIQTTDRQDWETPQALFDQLNAEFGFDLDVAASHTNAKCATYYTEAEDGLTLPWTGTVWCNPPYGKQIADWMRKGWEAAQGGATVVLLVPSRTDASWFHDYALKGEVRFIRGRLRFGGSTENAPFPSVLVIFRPPQTAKEDRTA